MKKILLSGLCILALSGIVLNSNGISGQVDAATEVVTSPPSQKIEIPMADGLKIQGTFYSVSGSEKAPAVLLLHQLGGTRVQWEPLIMPLAQKGYNILAVDMRGHGLTGGDRNWTLAESDAHALMDWLRKQPSVDPDHVVVIGASIGANLALRVCATDDACHATIALSPDVNYEGVDARDAIKKMPKKSIFMAASQLDESSALGVKSLAFSASKDVNLLVRIYASSAAHGVGMLGAKDLIPLMMQWLDNYNN
ncbi:MAG: alpha/beta fold hydrolase [Chloroflexota bacterium]